MGKRGAGAGRASGDAYDGEDDRESENMDLEDSQISDRSSIYEQEEFSINSTMRHEISIMPELKRSELMQKLDLGAITSNEAIQKLPLNYKENNKLSSMSGVAYRKKKVSDFVTIKNLDLEIKKGEFVCILGDVGSGKSSIIQLMIGDLLYMQRDYFKLFRNLEINDYLQERIKQISKMQLNEAECPIHYAQHMF